MYYSNKSSLRLHSRRVGFFNHRAEMETLENYDRPRLPSQATSNHALRLCQKWNLSIKGPKLIAGLSFSCLHLMIALASAVLGPCYLGIGSRLPSTLSDFDNAKMSQMLCPQTHEMIRYYISHLITAAHCKMLWAVFTDVLTRRSR